MGVYTHRKDEYRDIYNPLFDALSQIHIETQLVHFGTCSILMNFQSLLILLLVVFSIGSNVFGIIFFLTPSHWFLIHKQALCPSLKLDRNRRLKAM